MAFEIPDFVPPEFVSDSNPEDIQERMMTQSPGRY